MPSTLLKAGYVSVKEDKTRVIDSNRFIFERLNELNKALEEKAAQDAFADDFTEGLDAEQVEALLTDREEESLSEEEMSATRAKADEIINSANEEAEAIISGANASADEILSNAGEEAKTLKSQAYEEGFSKGEEAGYQEGLKKAQALEEELREKEAQMMSEYEEAIAALEPQFVDTLSGIYEHIFNVSLSKERELILYLLKDAIRNIEGGRNFLVHVSADDFSYVSQNRAELENLIGANSTLELIEDATLGANEAYVEAESGIFDCGLGTELEMLKKELRLLSYSESDKTGA